MHRGVVFSSNFTDQRLYRHDPGQTPTPITPETGGRVRYADGRVTSDGMRMICVRERHEDDGVVNEIVCIPTDGSGEASIVVGGRDFFSTPRISPDGAKLAWLTWDLPYLPWDGSELWVADLDADRGGVRRTPRRREGGDGVDLPTGVGSGRCPALRLGPHRLVEPVSRGRRRGARDLPDGCGVRLATVGVRCLDVRVPRRRPDRVHLDAERRAACLRDRPAHRRAAGPGSAVRRDRLPVHRRRRADDRVHGREHRHASAGRGARLPCPVGRRAEGERSDHGRTVVPVRPSGDRVPDGRRPHRARVLLSAGEQGLRRAGRRAAAADRDEPRRSDVRRLRGVRHGDAVLDQPRVRGRRRELRREHRLRAGVPRAAERELGRGRHDGLHQRGHATWRPRARSTAGGS